MLLNTQELDIIQKLFREGDLELGEDYRLQFVPVFSPSSCVCRYKYLYDSKQKWESVGRQTICRVQGGYFMLELWHKKDDKAEFKI